MAAAGTNKILTHCGIVDSSGKLTTSGRQAFINQVAYLMTAGNSDGKKLPLALALDLAVPLQAGPTYPAPSLIDPFKKEPLFWFDSEPYFLLSLPYLQDPNSLWSKTFLDGLYQSIASGLNIPGSYVPPLFDPSIYFPDITFDLKVDFPSLGVKIPQVLAPKLPQLAIDLGGSIPIPPLPSVPSISLPTLPDAPFPPPVNFGVAYALPDFFIKFTTAIPKLAVPSLPLSLPGLFLDPLSILLDVFLGLLLDLNFILTLPKLLVATMLVIIHNVAVMLACDIIGLILGSGSIVKSIAQLGGLST